jgi:hypothetical protein
MTNMQAIMMMSSHWTQPVLECREYTSDACAVDRLVLAKLCSTALSVQSSICDSGNQQVNVLNQHITEKER